MSDATDSEFVRHALAEDGTLTIALVGELDVANTDAVRAELAPIVKDVTAGPILFDLSELAFIDSSGLAVLLHVAKTCGHVVLRNASPIVRRIIEVTGLADILVIEE